MLTRLSYYYWSLRFPRWRDFVDMSFGIDARYARCKPFWARHIAICKELQSKLLVRVPSGSSVAVLGAGRLFDIDVELLCQRAGRICLYDADPSLVPYWRRAFAGREFEPHITDLTGTLTAWTETLVTALKQRPNIAGVIDVLNGLTQNLQAPPKIECDVILSLNVLSQLPIYWRDRVTQLLTKRLRLKTDQHGNFPDELLSALDNSMAALQRQHLEILQDSSARWILLSSDLHFMYYVTSHAHWQVDPAIHCAMTDPPLGSPYRLLERDSWLWHIAPQHLENAEHGAIHEVQAWMFESAF